MPVRRTEIPMQQRQLSITPASINEDERTIDVVWTTGAAYKRWDWWTGKEYMEVLEVSDSAVNMERLNNGAPVLDSHDSWSTDNVVAMVERAWLKDGEGWATLRFAKNDDRADKIWNKVSQGILRNLSVGYSVEKFMESEDNGQRTFTATSWTPLEISIVAIPADAAANIRSRSAENKFSCMVEYRIKHTRKRNNCKEPNKMSRKANKKNRNLKRQLEAASPATVETVAEVVDEEVTKIDEAVESALDQLEAATEAAPAEVTQIITDLVEAVDIIATEAQDQIDAALEDDPGEGGGQADDRNSDDEDEETRAGRIVEICALADTTAREALEFIERGVSPAHVRNQMLKRKAQAFKDNPTRSTHSGGVKTRGESLSNVAKEQFNK